jgi:hypothetical protein
MVVSLGNGGVSNYFIHVVRGDTGTFSGEKIMIQPGRQDGFFPTSTDLQDM